MTEKFFKRTPPSTKIVKVFGGPFCVLGWITPAVTWPCDFGVGESGLA